MAHKLGNSNVLDIKFAQQDGTVTLKQVLRVYSGSDLVWTSEVAPGQVEFTTPGTYQWVVPDGVESISAVVVGGGGGGACSRNGTGYGSGSGGGGGGLAYNTFAVTPGETLDIIVGSVGVNGLASSQSAGGAGGFSAIQRSSTDLVRANGGLGGNWATSGNGGAVVVGTGGSGGKGGVRGASFPEIGGGGGGAGGYSGAGGEGGGGSDATGKAGSGGAGGGAGGGNRRGGGGVGIYGEGTSGSAVASGSAGNPGSGGIGLLYGAGGGGGQGSFPNQNGQAGGAGAVRIIWGNSSVTREYPSTNTQDY